MNDYASTRWVLKWLRFLILVSVGLVLITLASYALQGSVAPETSMLLFWLGLGGENNVGAWWSGALLLLGAILAFDGFACLDKSEPERRGWLTLSVILAMLSFDEVASLHEYLAITYRPSLLVPAFVGAALTLYAFQQLIKAEVERGVILRLGLAFALIATIPLQESIQHSRNWESPVFYGIRALTEEGVELTAMLIFIAVAGQNASSLLGSAASNVLALTAAYRGPLSVVAVVSIPLLAAATFALPYPGGPADWLAVSLYLLCALNVVRRYIIDRSAVSSASLLLLAFYLAASVMSNALQLDWDPVVLGVPIGVRGVGTCALLLAAGPLLRMNGRSVAQGPLGLAALVALIASLRPEAQFFWCAFPPAVALYVYVIESRVSAAAGRMPRVGVQPANLAH